MLMHVVDWDADGDLDVLVFYNRNRCNGEGCIHLRPVVFVERLDDGTLLQHHDVLATGLGDYLQAVDWNGDGRLALWIAIEKDRTLSGLLKNIEEAPTFCCFNVPSICFKQSPL